METHEQRLTEGSGLSTGTTTPSTPTAKRGFAALDPETRRRIASRGGKAAHNKGRAHEFSPDEARQAGKKGGERVSKNRDHMAEIGKKGGERVSADRDHMAKIGRRGGEIVSENRAHMAEIGKKGGEARHLEHAPSASNSVDPSDDDANAAE